MKRGLAMMMCGLAGLAVGTPAVAARPQQEKQFVDAYRKAHASKDAKGLRSETRDKNGSSSGNSEVFVGESEGRLYILVPAAGR